MYMCGTFVASKCMHMIRMAVLGLVNGFGFGREFYGEHKALPKAHSSLLVANGKGCGVCLYGIRANLCEPPTRCEIICYVIYGIESIFSTIYE